MTLNEYQLAIDKFAIHPPGHEGRLYCALKLAGEAGEVSEKFGKLLRGDYIYNPDFRASITKELGDVLWAVARLAWLMDVPLDEVARMNIDKLTSRLERGVIRGSGDDR